MNILIGKPAISFNIIPLVILTVAVMYPHTVQAGTEYYVDKNIGVEKCNKYDIRKRECGSGKDIAYRRFSGVVTVTTPGDRVNIRAGTYNEQLSPGVSGEKGKEITYTNFEKEKVIITGRHRPAIDLSNRQYLIIEGL